MSLIRNAVVLGLLLFVLVTFAIVFDVSYTGNVVNENFNARYFVDNPDTAVDDYNSRFENLPNFARSLLGSERINLDINMSDGTSKVFGLITKNGKIVGFNETKIDGATFSVYTTEEVINGLAESSNAGDDFAQAIIDDRIKVEGLGIIPNIKLKAAKLFLKAKNWVL